MNKAAINAKLRLMPNPNKRNGRTNSQTTGYINSNKSAIGQHNTNRIVHNTRLINSFISTWIFGVLEDICQSNNMPSVPTLPEYSHTAVLMNFPFANGRL